MMLLHVPAALPSRADMKRLAAAFVMSNLAIAVAYVALVAPGTWFPRQDPIAWTAQQLTLMRGVGSIVGGELVVTSSGADGTVLVSIESDFRTDQYPAIAWAAIDIPEGADVRLLWRNDVAPSRINTAPVAIESGRPLPLLLVGNPAWIGHAKGIALLVSTRLDKPLHLRGAVAKPMGALAILVDRAREWYAFEAWTGESIEKVVGGADVQDLPLPALVALATSLTIAIWFGWTRLRRVSPAALPGVIVVAFLAAWLVLDARYVFNLARQTADTAARYKGLDWREKHLAAEDGELFEFVEKARAKLPAAPARVFVAAEAHYFRGRAAYYLYPHNVYYDPARDAMPPVERLHSGDYLLIYRRHGAQYDAAARQLRWDGGKPVTAMLELVDRGAALFRIE